jgi:uncharacterized cupin superfamily protein
MTRPIHVEHNPSAERLQQLGVFRWPVWEKEESEFEWFYDSEETCYLLEGHVIVTPEEGTPVEIGAGDLVIFPAGLACTWKITQRVRKHYRFT